MKNNIIRTNIPGRFVIEYVNGFKLVDYYYDDIEFLGFYKTLTQAMEAAKSLDW